MTTDNFQFSSIHCLIFITKYQNIWFVVFWVGLVLPITIFCEFTLNDTTRSSSYLLAWHSHRNLSSDFWKVRDPESIPNHSRSRTGIYNIAKWPLTQSSFLVRHVKTRSVTQTGVPVSTSSNSGGQVKNKQQPSTSISSAATDGVPNSSTKH